MVGHRPTFRDERPRVRAAPAVAKPADPAKAKKPDPGEKLFGEFLVPRFQIDIAEPEMQILRQKPREYVKTQMKITLPDGQQALVDVGVHLKGAAGSFRGIDDRPALTVNFDKFKKGQKFFGLDKIHLNNSVQDGGYANELVCSELNLAAGVPTARVTHATVKINNRDLGLYVLKESYDKTFLKRSFGDDKGNLYDGGFCQEIDANLQRDAGEGPDDKADLKKLIDACREGDLAKRIEKLEKILDIDEFCRFMAMELICAHWDGYVRNRNNYRIYFNPSNGGRAAFIPHGMDQMFGDPNFDAVSPNALVSQAIMQTPELRRGIATSSKNSPVCSIRKKRPNGWTSIASTSCRRSRNSIPAWRIISTTTSTG
ncbi:MAG: CotH kinase family protein [Pirellulales bacterium]